MLHVDGDWPEPDTLLGQQLGAFRLAEIVGSGGMATVYRAHRADEEFEQQVAVKVIHAGLTDALLRGRFLQERQILANLSHPNIARVFDGGLADDGRPYLVMEFVDGVPIDEHCERAELGLADRVALVRQVAETVQYAHTRLVAHRDLKPGNILVDATGQVKLLDFGIASMFDDPGTEMALFTPAYAAPEQFSGKRVGQAVDIYQLGALTYRLLTGRSPYGDLQGVGPEELRHRVVDEHVPFMSWADRDLEHSKQLAGDLDAIVAKCLEKDPTQRYPAVASLVADLSAWQADRPVSVMPASRAYLVGKFARRHRVPMGLFGGFLLLLAGATAWYLVNLSQSRQLAEQSAQEAQQVASFLEGLLQSVDPLKGGGATGFAERLTEAGQRLAKSTVMDANVKHELLALLAETLMDRGDYKAVIAMLEPLQAQRQDAHFASYLSLLGYAHYRNGDLTQGRSLMTDSFEIQSDASAPLPLAITLERLSSLERREGNYQRSRSLAEEALAIKQQQTDLPEVKIASSRNSLGLSLRELGEYEAAARQFEQAISVYRREGESSLKVAMTLSNLADVQRNLGTLDQALENAGAAVELSRASRRDNPTLLATALTSLGNVQMALEQPAAAVNSYRESYELYSAAFGNGHPRLIAPAYNEAVALRRQGDCTKAMARASQILSVARDHFDASHPQVRAISRLVEECAASAASP